MTEDAMGPPPTKSFASVSTDSLPETSDETSSSPSRPTYISDPSQPEIQPELGQDDLPPEIDVSPVDNANLMEGKIVEEDCADRINEQSSNSNNAVPYSIPPWSGPPCHDYFLEVLKDGAIINQFNINKKGAYMFGRVDLCDFVLEHPTISRFHAVIQFKSNGNAYLYDVGSTHGTSVNKKQVKTRTYVDLHVGDVIRFGQSSRLYIFQGPTDLMPPEVNLKSLRNAKMRLEMRDMEASLERAKLGAALSEGISWGLQEDAEEEAEDDVEEITWQTYKGQLTQKQEKTREKVLKRLEKIAHMKKEIDAIRAKDIAQGGLTQGQQTQIARNEQRISQILEELENLEETLNDSIRESIGARAGGTSRGGKRGDAEDGEDYMSDDDEFYDRTRKPLKHGQGQSIETADTLLDKQEAIVTEMEDLNKLLMGEDEREQENEIHNAGDALDAYMSTLSSEVDSKKKDKLQKELAALQSELDRVSYLLKIADPSGEAAKRRTLIERPIENVMTISTSAAIEQPKPEQSLSRKPEKKVNGSQRPVVTPKSSTDKLSNVDATSESSQRLKVTEVKSYSTTSGTETAVYAVAKPQWLGAVDVEKQDGSLKPLSNEQDSDQFVDYKDRKQILEKQAVPQTSEFSEIESAAPGLIIRKRKPVEVLENETGPSEQSKEAELQAEDAVALLLKHSRGYGASDEDLSHDIQSEPARSQNRERKKPKKKLGPERPTFLKPETDYETWVPPEGQSGDGRTSLNDRYGY